MNDIIAFHEQCITILEDINTFQKFIDITQDHKQKFSQELNIDRLDHKIEIWTMCQVRLAERYSNIMEKIIEQWQDL